MTTGQGNLPTGSPLFSRIATTAAVAVLVVLVGGVIADLPGRSAAVIAVAVAALLVSAGCVAFVIFARSESDLQASIALVLAGMGGAVLTLLPGGPGFVVVCLGVAGLGMRLPLVRAVISALVVFASVNLAFVLSGQAHSLAGLAGEDVGVAFIFAIGAFTRANRISHDKAKAAQARAEGLLEQLRASQAAQAQAVAVSERARLAREVHDILAHALSGLVLSLDTMELLGRQGAGAGADSETMAKMLEQVGRAQRIARDGLADTRRAIAALRGEELPGPALLDQLVRETSSATGIKAVLAVTGPPRPLLPEIGLAVYRTAQEALVNTAKYAGPGARAEIRLDYGTDEIELTVLDERAEQARPPGPAGLTFGGYGLTGMRERAELLGGKLTAGPTEAGFGVLLRLPAASAAPARPPAPASADPVAS